MNGNYIHAIVEGLKLQNGCLFYRTPPIAVTELKKKICQKKTVPNRKLSKRDVSRTRQNI